LAQLQDFKKRMGWTFPWASSFGSEFNFDFGVSFTREQQARGIEYNYRREPGVEPSPEPAPSIPSRTMPEGDTTGAAYTGTDINTYARERPGMSAFLLEDGVLYHTYSTYSRGVDALWNAYQWLDRAPRGRNETGYWWQHRDRYGNERPAAGACCHTEAAPE
jgi:predicted dithiol-disulfide oxidoreductase (DUF899 family)